jgi:hypothetical protein
MTRKKYIKVLMSLGVQRNEAHRMAEYQRQQNGSYTDIRADGWPGLHLMGMRCGIIARRIVDKVTTGILLCSNTIADLGKELDDFAELIGETAGGKGDEEDETDP